MQLLVKLVILIVLISILKLVYHASDYCKYVDSKFLYQVSPSFLDTWIPKHTKYDKNEIAEAALISSNEMGILDSDSAYLKVKKISYFLLSRFHHIKDNPTDEIFAMSPLQQYKAIKEGKSGLYCTQYSAIFTFFCRTNGLITRQIESVGSNDRHIVNETYCPETKEWVFTDLANNIVELKNEVHRMNLIAIYKALTNNQLQKKIKSCRFKDSTLIYVPFEHVRKNLEFDYDPKCIFHFYYEMNLDWVYGQTQRNKRFFYNNIWYVNYANHPKQENWFYVKNAAFVLIALILVSFLFPWKKSHKSNL